MPEQLSEGQRDRSGDSTSPGGLAPRRIAAAIVLAVAVAAGLAASSSAEQPAGRGQAREVPPIYVLVYLSSDADRRISAAKHKLIAECMAAQGLSYTPYVEAVGDEQVLAELRPFGLETLEPPTAVAPPPEVPADERHARALFGDPDRQVVARGKRLEVASPATGCIADAETRLLGADRVRGTELRLRLYDGERDAREQLDRDPQFRAANDHWRVCLNRVGVDAPDPLALLGALPSDADVQSHPAAVADVRCKRDTGYLHTAYTRLAELQRAWLAAHPKIPAGWTALRQRQDAVARQVLNDAT